MAITKRNAPITNYIHTISQWQSRVRFCRSQFDKISVWHHPHTNVWSLMVWHHRVLRLIIHIDNYLMEHLLYHKYIVPKISDKEYSVHIALGTISIHSYRVYNITEKALV